MSWLTNFLLNSSKCATFQSGDNIISPVEQLPLAPSGPLLSKSGCLQHPSSCCHNLKQYLGLHKLQSNSGNLPALATVLSGMLCFELDPPEYLQCRELDHQTPSSFFCPCLTPFQGSLSPAATALWQCQEKGIHCRWEQPRDLHCSRGRGGSCSEGGRGSPAYHCCSLHEFAPAQRASSTHQGTPSSDSEAVVCKDRHVEGWKGGRLKCSLMLV